MIAAAESTHRPLWWRGGARECPQAEGPGMSRQRTAFATAGDGAAGGTDDDGRLTMPNRAQRDELFKRFDFNGNGMLSLAEIDKAVVELWPQFDHKPALMRAYKAADRNEDGFIRRREFRLLLKYIIYFDQMWARFDEIDRDHDHRLTPAEFAEGCATMGIRLTRSAAAAEFALMDENGGGFILFDEFCHWCARRQVPVEGEALTGEESEMLGGAVPAGPPLPEREPNAFMRQPLSRRSTRRAGSAARSGPMVCYLHRNGEMVVPGDGCLLKTNPAAVPSFAKFLDDVTARLDLTSYAKKLFRPDGTEVTALEEIRPKEDYVAAWTNEFLPPKLVPKHKTTRWNSASPGRGAQRASPTRGTGERTVRSPRRSYVRSPGRSTAGSAVRRGGSARRSRADGSVYGSQVSAAAAAMTPANLSLADKRRLLLEKREQAFSGVGRNRSPGRTAAGVSPGRTISPGARARASSPAELRSEVRRLQAECEREVAEQRAMEKRLRQLDEAEAKASRAAEKQAMRLVQEEERRFAAEERQLEAAEARLSKERAAWDRDRTPPPRMRLEMSGEDQRDGPRSPPSQQEEHAAAAKLQANYRGYTTRREMESGRRLQAEREAREEQTRMELAELERSAAVEAVRAPAPIVARAPVPRAESPAVEVETPKLSAIERARQRRAMQGVASPGSQQPRVLHYATSLTTSKRATVEEFVDALTSGKISAAGVVIWTKGMATWKLPADALDVFPELTTVLQRNGPTLAEKRRMVLEARAGTNLGGRHVLREQLQRLKVMALFKKATAAGVPEEELEVRCALHFADA